MDHTFVFATNNNNKLQEVRNIISEAIKIKSLQEVGCLEEIPETGSSLFENALIKARFVFEKYGYNCFADDTGLEVDALNGEPGVYSARYAGDTCDSVANMQKLLQNLSEKSNRKAQFRTVIALIIDQKEYFFEGVVSGAITSVSKGNSGFGYDPVFIPDGYEQTFAEMGEELKNTISHRAKAVRKLVDFLNTIID